MNERRPTPKTLSERIASVEQAIHGNGSIGLREQIDNMRNDMQRGFQKLEENQQRIQDNANKISHQVARMIGGIGALILILQLIIQLV